MCFGLPKVHHGCAVHKTCCLGQNVDDWLGQNCEKYLGQNCDKCLGQHEMYCLGPKDDKCLGQNAGSVGLRAEGARATEVGARETIFSFP